jgi:predicted TIM-barrel fold metal-dependent hydrolase
MTHNKPKFHHVGCGCAMTRRGFLSGLAALGASALGACSTGSQTSAAAEGGRWRIDTHHHFFAPSYVEAIKSPDPLVKSWTLARTLDDMDQAGVQTAMLSVTTPQVRPLDPATARRIARESNEHAARLMSDHPGRFGSFAMLPMGNADDALREMEYALGTLKADGIGVLTSYGDKWLGHPSFAPIMNELNRRKAILYTHPTLANCCSNLVADVPPTVIEFGTDTSRTITDIVFSGTAARCPDVRFIFSHAGGSLPFLVERLERMPVINPKLKDRVPNGVMHELTRFYYDTAWTANPMALASLTRMVTPAQILLGSDYPYRTGADNVKGLAEYGFTSTDLRIIQRDNALRLMPRLRGT